MYERRMSRLKAKYWNQGGLGPWGDGWNLRLVEGVSLQKQQMEKPRPVLWYSRKISMIGKERLRLAKISTPRGMIKPIPHIPLVNVIQQLKINLLFTNQCGHNLIKNAVENWLQNNKYVAHLSKFKTVCKNNAVLWLITNVKNTKVRKVAFERMEEK